MPSPFNSVNPVSVGLATKKSHYDRAFNNTLALQEGSKEVEMLTINGVTVDPAVAPSGDARIAYRSDRNEIRMSRNGAAYEPLGDLIHDKLYYR